MSPPSKKMWQVDEDPIEALVFVFWVLKDLGWVLLMQPLAFPCALVAVCMEVHQILTVWRSSSWPVRAHFVAAASWLIGNGVWMTTEFLFDTHAFNKENPGILPWYEGPLAGPNDERYRQGVAIARCMFGFGVLALVSCYIGSACGAFESREDNAQSNPQDMEVSDLDGEDDALVFGVVTSEVYLMAYLFPWIVKDMLWTWELFIPAIACSVFVAFLMIDGYRRFRQNLTLAELFWFASNVCWIITELSPGAGDTVIWPRFVCGASLLVAWTISIRTWMRAGSTITEEAQHPDERTALVGSSK